MFELTPISTSNLFTAFQILIVIIGFYFSWKSLKATHKSLDAAHQSLEATRQNLAIGTRNAQAQLFNQMVIQGRDLQFKFTDVFYGGDSEAEKTAKQDQYFGTLIGYYSSCFEMKQILELPENVTKLYDEDLKELIMRNPKVRDKWNNIKSFHSRTFNDHVNNLIGGIR